MKGRLHDKLKEVVPCEHSQGCSFIPNHDCETCEDGMTEINAVIREIKKDYLKRVFKLQPEHFRDKKFLKDFLQGLIWLEETHRELQVRNALAVQEFLWIIDWLGEFTFEEIYEE